MGGEHLGLQSSPACCVTADPVLNFDPWPRQRSVMRGSCLTQNGARFRSQKESERHAGSGGERGRESSTTHRGLIYPLSLSRMHFFFFFPSFAFSFVFAAQKLLPFLPLHLLSFSLVFPPPPSLPPSPPLPLSSHPSSGCFFFGQQRAIISGHRRHRYGFMAAKDQQDSGREFVRRGFNESEASSAGEKCMQMRCTHQKGPWVGEASCRPSSRWAQRKMSGSGQKNDNKTPPPSFLLLLFLLFLYSAPRRTEKLFNTSCEMSL